MKVYLYILSLFFCGITYSQSTITGVVKDGNKKPIPGANIKIIGDSAGTVTDQEGNFVLNTSKNPPYTIEVSSVGYGTKKIEIKSKNQKVSVNLDDEETLLNEIVVSASRTPERVRESPVTIERFTIKDVKRAAAPSFYDGLENLKEVQMNTSSLSFKSINTRGFATVANTRFLQLVDGMDNSSPLLNFVLGNLIGVSEIDVQSVELLPGASSALYGANAFNGILFMTSQSPFTSQGITAYAKYGNTSQKAAGTNDFYDYGVRVAKALTPHFAAKANFTFMKGTDWYATNYNGLTKSGDEVIGVNRTDPSYNGVNVYGDEAFLNLKNRNAFGSSAYNLLPNIDISRTGYNETDLTESLVKNAKMDFSLHFKPWANSEKLKDVEMIWQSKFGIGNSVYQGASRYNLNGFFMQQHKIEFKGKNFFVRGYTTTEDGGRSYDMTFTALNINRAWKSDTQWFKDYGSAYGNATLGLVPGTGTTPAEAHAYARSKADTGRLLPGTPEFKEAFNRVIANPDVLKGSKLVDNSHIYHSDANYNFRDIIKPVEIQVGGSYRVYDLNSFGRIYTDDVGSIRYNEYGVYTQAQKKLMNDKLKLTGSIRYDKAKNFDGNYSPRLSFVYALDEQKNHNIRGSFQTGFRNPTTQDQYIGFDIGPRALVGSAPDNLDRYTEVRGGDPDNNNEISAAGQTVLGIGPTGTITLSGRDAYENSFTERSYFAFDDAYRAGPPSGLADAAENLVKANVPIVKPEQVKAFDLGYRGTIKGFALDINGYYNIYNDFIGGFNVVTPYYGNAETNPTDFSDNSATKALVNRDVRTYQVYTNTSLTVKSLGFGLGLSKKVYKDFELSGNYNYAQFDFDQAKDPDFEASFNTPKHRVKATLGNDKLFKNFGISVSGRWNSEYIWESTFADGIIKEATVIDMQANYSLTNLKSIIKIGATNLGGKEYGQVLGAGLIGQQYFVSWTITP
ncbi:TonB-dependent receptor [Flavobacterium luteum]|uniref:TonB-dependent receptor n=1 Tax=Flavobacterium luteum TaxID=2026654 RepID=A0A7J5AHA8_9FLAO|nr:TonB-dependent receptor [Flavobacterium luteum]KAB1156900.1 TonB-dependent receptor [Flavobacterium luteum]